MGFQTKDADADTTSGDSRGCPIIEEILEAHAYVPLEAKLWFFGFVHISFFIVLWFSIIIVFSYRRIHEEERLFKTSMTLDDGARFPSVEQDSLFGFWNNPLEDQTWWLHHLRPP